MRRWSLSWLPFAVVMFLATSVLSECEDPVAGMDRGQGCEDVEELRVLRESPLSKSRVVLRVMTFNIWLSGIQVNDGLGKIAKQIAKVNPDIVALQEVSTKNVVPRLIELLGGTWTGIHHNDATRKNPDMAILTRHWIVNGSYGDFSHGISTRIQLRSSGRQINFWSLHLQWRSYGPYACFNKLVTSISQINAGESTTGKPGRVQNILELLQHPRFRIAMDKSNEIPLIVAGDFNTPSHADWVEDNRHEHGGWVVRWPSTELLENAGLIDSYRAVNPDPVENPGHTWSTVYKANSEWDYTVPEPQDRIDFIFYRGPLNALLSRTYAGSAPLIAIPNHRNNEWPSDHYAVISTFSFSN